MAQRILGEIDGVRHVFRYEDARIAQMHVTARSRFLALLAYWGTCP